MNTDRHRPVVFISSTCYDLKQVREDLKDFFETNYGFQAMLSKFDSFPIDLCIGTFENCLNNVDNPQIYKFVAEIYNESKQWIYTYESVRDITTTMKHQLSLIFSDGLIYKKISQTLQPYILESDISTEAKRVL